MGATCIHENIHFRMTFEKCLQNVPRNHFGQSIEAPDKSTPFRMQPVASGYLSHRINLSNRFGTHGKETLEPLAQKW